VTRGHRFSRLSLLLTAVAVAPVLVLGATIPDTCEHSIHRFLEQDDTQHAYRATRRLEAQNGRHSAWLEAITEYSPQLGFRYEVTGEGGSGYIRTKVLRAVLDGEREIIAQGETSRSSLARANYTFQADGMDDQGLANVLLAPRRKERLLISGRMFLQPDGRLVRLEGQLARNPSFWIKDVDILWRYESINDVVVPVSLTSNAHVRFLGAATLRMTYIYSSIDGHPITPSE
jgi:hypothetical protein